MLRANAVTQMLAAFRFLILAVLTALSLNASAQLSIEIVEIGRAHV